MQFESPPGLRGSQLAISCLLAALFTVGTVVLVPVFGDVLYHPLRMLGVFGVYMLTLVLYVFLSPSRLILDLHAAWIGSGRHGQWLPYASIWFLRVEDTSSTATGSMAQLAIRTKRGTHRIQLRTWDAERALSELRARSQHASGIDPDDHAFLPHDRADAAIGARRIRRILLWRATIWGSAGFLAVLVAVYVFLAKGPFGLFFCLSAVFPFWKALRALALRQHWVAKRTQ
jgi:hypothetical protein